MPRRPDARRPDARRQGRKRRGGLVATAVAAVAVAAVLGGAFFVPPLLEGDDVTPAPQTAGGSTGAADVPPPPTGTTIDVATADGSKYRLATVTAGLGDRAGGAQQSPPPPGTTYAYIDYVLTNPSGQRSLLDFPGDVFVRRDLVAEQARGRCVWQPGVPETMCTPPVRSVVVRRLAGGELEPGEGGDRYLPPGSSYLVRATAEVPVSESTKRADLRLYVWKQLYMADQLAKPVPYPD